MARTMGSADILRMIQGGLDEVRANHEELSRLDAATGDGDHGSAMLRAVEAAEKAMQDNPDAEGAAVFKAMAWAMMGAAGGAPGPLFGSLFMGMGTAIGDDDLDCPAVATMFEAGLAKLQKQTKAQPGEKTMIDALVPAIEAIRATAEAGEDIGAALAASAAAAAMGAEATKDMLAKHGKARNLGERTLGHVDPGATSVACMFRGFSQAVAT